MTAPDGELQPECSEEPKLTAEEWAYVEALSEASPEQGGDS